jgi:imidazolonepropionase-like amidohydrolase
LPGLIDSHVHLSTNLAEEGWTARNTLTYAEWTDVDWAFEMVKNARAELEGGFTTVRDLGEPEPSKAIFSVRKAINAGIVPGPRILACGSAVTQTGGVADWLPFRPEIRAVFAGRSAVCNGAADCRRATRNEVRNGADVIKIYTTGGLGWDDDEPMFDDEAQAIVDTAHKLNRKVASHVTGAKGFMQAIRIGVDSIEHANGMTDEGIQLMKKKGIVFVPTLTPDLLDWYPDWVPKEVLKELHEKTIPEHFEMTRRAHVAGVKIAFGSDAGSRPHSMSWTEFLGLSKAGFTAMEAIEAATVVSADLLGLSKDIGTIEPGKSADIIATNANPLDDLHAFSQVAFVMKAGEVFKISNKETR